jgi:chromosome segregation protein
MYLKNLTAFGFKSFPDKTTLNFQPGVTAIVGPNGCGKSNVSDAIQWVLGEQSAKALRGGEMADVIFNGTDTRKPMGMAEVSLTIGGVDDEHLKAAGVEVAYNEVTITRRVFRDGGSEYFLNRTACRLKDIQQFFMGTGVGRASYSILAQGNITQVLSSKPEDRRMIFEEAAGITKFKAQKKEALRKLEQTEQNLLRIADLIREVKRQIGSLQRQAGKARRYKQLLAELQHLDTQLARHQFDVLQSEIAARQSSILELQSEAELCAQKVTQAEDEIAELRSQLSSLEQEISRAQQQAVELKAETDRHQSRIHFNEERLRELESQQGKALSDIAQSEERKVAAEQELVHVTERLDASIQSVQQHQQTLEARSEALQAVERELRATQENLRQAQAEAFATAQQLTRVRNEINTLEMQRQGNSVRVEKLAAEKIQLHEEQTRLEARLQEFSVNVELGKASAQTWRGTVEERQTRLRELQQSVAALTTDLETLLRQQAEKRSRLNVLEQLQDSHEGFSAGALAALKTAQNVIGSLADKIKVPDEYVVAVETALGHHLQLVLTQEPDSAHRILSDLNVNKKGRASIAALGLQDNGLGDHANGENGLPSSARCRALSVIESDSTVHSLLNRLLGHTVIVPDLAAATEGWRETGGKYDFVTVTGELLNRHGIFTGGYLNGSGSGKTPSSILGRKNQIAELESALAQLQEQVNEISRSKGALASEQTQLQASLQQAQTELRTQEVAIATREGEFAALQNSQRVLRQKIETVTFEIQTLEAQQDEGAQKREALAMRLRELESCEESLQHRVGELTAAIDGLRQQRDSANTALTETRVSLATDEQLCASFRKQQQPLQQRIHELQHLVEQRRAEIGSFLDRKTQAESEITESQQRVESLQHAREGANARVAELLAEKESQELNVTSREDDLRLQRQRLSDLQQQRGGLEVELAQKGMAVQNLRERIQQKIPGQPRRRPQRVHYDHHRRRRRPEDSHAQSGGNVRQWRFHGLDRCLATGDRPATAVGRNGPGESRCH